MRTIFIQLLCLIIGFIYSAHTAFANENIEPNTHFVITAYYSPLPGQLNYQTGSYAGDLRLNGNGTHTASGKQVFEGALAGPSNYPFGTKIYIEGYGVGVIEDRGGAIVKSGVRTNAYDRLDIWVGYGDEGLAKALKWGRRTVPAAIVSRDTPVTLSLDSFEKGEIKIGLYVDMDSHASSIKKLQELFTKAGLYTGEIDGEYDSIKDTLIDFQIDSGIIDTSTHEEAGYFGKKTSRALTQVLSTTTDTTQDSTHVIQKAPQTVNQEKPVTIKPIQIDTKVLILLEYGDLKITPDSESDDIKRLQELLTKLGEYAGDTDGRYDSIKNTLIDIQLALDVVPSRDDDEAGYFGKKTKTAMWEFYEKNPELTITKTNKSEPTSSPDIDKPTGDTGLSPSAEQDNPIENAEDTHAITHAVDSDQDTENTTPVAQTYAADTNTSSHHITISEATTIVENILVELDTLADTTGVELDQVHAILIDTVEYRLTSEMDVNKILILNILKEKIT